MADGLYERDVLSWAEQQAMLLRRMAAGERLNETLDWPHIIEEVAEVGLSELRAVMSLLPDRSGGSPDADSSQTGPCGSLHARNRRRSVTRPRA